jgi:hypothetical protein
MLIKGFLFLCFALFNFSISPLIIRETNFDSQSMTPILGKMDRYEIADRGCLLKGQECRREGLGALKLSSCFIVLQELATIVIEQEEKAVQNKFRVTRQIFHSF